MTKKVNALTAAKVAAGAKKENKVINSNPGYIFRTLNKRAQGRDKDAKEVEGYSREATKELFNRLNNTFAGAGFWWSSIYAVNGRPVTSLSPLSDSTACYLDPSYTPDANHVLIHFAGGYYLGTLGTWSESAVIDAAKARLSLVEKYAQAIDKVEQEQEQERKEQKAQERKERKAENQRKAQERKEQREQAQELAKTIQELTAQVAAGTLSQEDAFAKVQALMVA